MTRVRGVGLGLRWEFFEELLERSAAEDAPAIPLDFVEISPENYMRRGGRYAAALERVAARYPVVTHGLTLSLGGVDPLDATYVRDLKDLVERVGSPWHSDHACFGSIDGRSAHELLPVSFTRDGVSRMADRVRRVQDALRVPVAVENISYYWHPGRADFDEAEFLSRLCEAADCGLLLDVNNAYVNASNFGFDVDEWMRAAPLERAVQIHVAGHEWFTVDDRGIGAPSSPSAAGSMIVDTHGADASAPVLALLDRVLVRTGPVPIVLERDHHVPPLDELLVEVEKLRAIAATSTGRLRPG